MSDRAILLIDCDKNVVELSDPDFDITNIGFPIKDKKSQLIGNILISRMVDLMKMNINELQDANLKIIKGS